MEDVPHSGFHRQRVGKEIGGSYVIRQDLPRFFARRFPVHRFYILYGPKGGREPFPQAVASELK
jgi:hypothetical protein